MRKRFIFYGLAGWCVEVFWTGFMSLLKGDVMLSSYSSLWMFFIYGLSVFLEPIHNRIRHIHYIGRGLTYTCLIFIGEFLSGGLLTLFGACPWDYSDSPLSILGLVRLDYAPVWFSTGLLFEILHNYLIKLETFAEYRI